MSDHIPVINKFNVHLCSKCGLPVERLTTHCCGSIIDMNDYKLLESIFNKRKDFVNGEWVIKNESS
jgi:hypothetical protein